MSNNQSPNVDSVLDALGHQTRRNILSLLQNSPSTVIGLANQLPISRPAVSKHLRVLEQASLVSFKSKGSSNLFFINPKGFQAASRYLEPFWDQALARFKVVAENIEDTNS